MGERREMLVGDLKELGLSEDGSVGGMILIKWILNM
jgi:hypothetical protein